MSDENSCDSPDVGNVSKSQIHPIYDAIANLERAQAAYSREAEDGCSSEECEARYEAVEDAKNALLMTPIGRNRMRWAIEKKLSLISDELYVDVSEKYPTDAALITWIGAIRRDLAEQR